MARVRFREAVENPIFGVVFQNSRRDTVFTANTLATDPEPGMFAAGEEVTFRLAFDLVFAPDRYYATPAVARAGTGIAWLDRRERFASVMVTGMRDTDGIVDLEHRIDDRARRRATATRSPDDRRGRRAARPPDRRADRARRRPAAASGTSRARSRSPTSSCASSARCSATCGS